MKVVRGGLTTSVYTSAYQISVIVMITRKCKERLSDSNRATPFPSCLHLGVREKGSSHRSS